MSNLYDSIFTQNGIQDFFIIYDTLFLNCKVPLGTKYDNYIIIEKLNYDYESIQYEKSNKGIMINFGDTGFSEPLKISGNGFVDYFFDDSTKTTFLIGVSSINDLTFPVVYSYDLNQNKLKLEFNSDASIPTGIFNSNQKPFIKKTKDNRIDLMFSTTSASQKYLNKIDIKLKELDVNILDYKLMSYDLSGTYSNNMNDNLIFEYQNQVSFLSGK